MREGRRRKPRDGQTVAALTRTGIPVMAHLGFTPQSVRSLGMRIQGREHNDADRITEGPLLSRRRRVCNRAGADANRARQANYGGGQHSDNRDRCGSPL
jgi:hypothetical protein